MVKFVRNWKSTHKNAWGPATWFPWNKSCVCLTHPPPPSPSFWGPTPTHFKLICDASKANVSATIFVLHTAVLLYGKPLGRRAWCTLNIWLMFQSELSDSIGTSEIRLPLPPRRDTNHRGKLWDFWVNVIWLFLTLFCVPDPCRCIYCFPSECQWNCSIIPKVVFVFILTPNVSWTFIRPHGSFSQER